MNRRPHVIERKRRSHTLRVDTAKAQRFGAMVRRALADLFAQVPAEDHAGLSRTAVQEIVTHDAEVRGEHEARTWAAKQGRAA